MTPTWRRARPVPWLAILALGVLGGLVLRAAAPQLALLRRTLEVTAGQAAALSSTLLEDDGPSPTPCAASPRDRRAERTAAQRGAVIATAHRRVLLLRQELEDMAARGAVGGSVADRVDAGVPPPDDAAADGDALLALLAVDVGALLARVADDGWRLAVARSLCRDGGAAAAAAAMTPAHSPSPSPTPSPGPPPPSPPPCPSVALPDVNAVGPLAPPPTVPARRVVFVTYGGDDAAGARDRLTAAAATLKTFDEARALRPQDIDAEFAARYAGLLADAPLGLWKPHLLHAQLEALADGDVLVYADAGCVLLSDPAPYVRLAERWGMLTFRIAQPLRKFAKGVAFRAAGLPLDVWGREALLNTAVLVLQRRDATRALVAEWLRYAEDPLLLSGADASAVAPNAPDFVAHRGADALWSLVVYRHAAPLVLQQESWPRSRARVFGAPAGTKGAA